MIDSLPPPAKPSPEPTARPLRGETRGNFSDWLQTPTTPNVDEAGPESKLASEWLPTPHLAETTPVDMPMQIELRVRHTTGQRETVSLPWRLAATGHLEWASAMGHAILPTLVNGVDAMHLDHPGQRSAADAHVAFSDGANSALLSQAPVAARHGLVMEQVATAKDDEIPATSRALFGLAAESWLERLIRWVERQGRAPEVWVRDYRLNEGDAQHLVDVLRSRANEHGFELERIVINARDVWRSTPHITHAENR